MTRIAFLIAVLLAVLPTSANATTQAAAAVAEWTASALALVPPELVAGDVLQADVTDAEAVTGYIALYPAGADNPKTPASAFDPGMMLVAKLARIDGNLTAMSGEVRPRDLAFRSAVPRESSSARSEDDYRTLDAELLAKASTVPEGTMPCDLHGWSDDKDSHGLNVRAGPSATAKVLGTLPPPYKYKSDRTAEMPEGGWRTEFSILGFKDGWFLIAGATPPGKEYAEDGSYPRSHPKPYAGRGWVAASKVGAAFANGDTRMGGLFQAPHIDARWTPAHRNADSPISADGGPKRIFACSGFWALVESPDGVRGWWRRLCSNQVTNCS